MSKCSMSLHHTLLLSKAIPRNMMGWSTNQPLNASMTTRMSTVLFTMLLTFWHHDTYTTHNKRSHDIIIATNKATTAFISIKQITWKRDHCIAVFCVNTLLSWHDITEASPINIFCKCRSTIPVYVSASVVCDVARSIIHLNLFELVLFVLWMVMI